MLMSAHGEMNAPMDGWHWVDSCPHQQTNYAHRSWRAWHQFRMGSGGEQSLTQPYHWNRVEAIRSLQNFLHLQ